MTDISRKSTNDNPGQAELLARRAIASAFSGATLGASHGMNCDGNWKTPMAQFGFSHMTRQFRIGADLFGASPILSAPRCRSGELGYVDHTGRTDRCPRKINHLHRA